MIDTLTFADALAARLAETLKSVPASTRPRVDVIGLVVRFAASDSRYQVVDVAARLRDDAPSNWQPSAFSLRGLGTVGDPVSDPSLAGLWREHRQNMAARPWDDAGPAGQPGELTSLELHRGAFLSVLPTAARYLRRRLRRQLGWDTGLVIIVVTDHVGDQVLLTSQQLNGDALPAGAYEYLRDLEEGRRSI